MRRQNGCGCNSDPCSTGTRSAPVTCNEPFAAIQSGCNTTDECAETSCCDANLFATLVTSFNMPACGATGSVLVDDASRIFPGAVLYAQTVGYLSVEEVIDSSELLVKNHCPDCQVLGPGEPVPVGTMFGVGIPFCVAEGDLSFLGPRLASDYFIPLVGSCVTVAATSVDGLSTGDIVAINTNRYRIDDIPNVASLIICNDGDGGEPGLLVQADPDGDGVYNYPISRVSSTDPCTEDPAEDGRLIVCNSAIGGSLRALEGSITNQVPAWDESLGKFVLKVINDLSICVSISECCLVLDPDNDLCDSYLVQVHPNVTQIQELLEELEPNPVKVKIGDDPFCVISTIAPNTLRVVPDFVVDTLVTYNLGTSICVEECCRQCSPQLQTLGSNQDDQGCDTSEILLGTGIVTVPVTNGEFTIMLPGTLMPWETGFEPDDPYLWEMYYRNLNCCDCRKYVEVVSNFELAINLPTGVNANAEFRILKTAPVANSQAFASMPFIGGLPQISVAEPSLIPAYQCLNTYKGTVFDRDFVKPGDSNIFRGHIRIVLTNNTGVTQNVTYVIQWRVWLKAWNFNCAHTTITVP